MITVSELAKRCNISRTTVLYYERIGLLQPNHRSDNGYRWYGEQQIQRLKSIMAFRSYGVSVSDIAALLDNDEQQQAQSELLKNQFQTLEDEIQKLRKQQQAIVVTLQEPDMLAEKVVSKARWVEIMISLGFDEQDMTQWHQTFEKMKPKQHQAFLQSLGIDDQEIERIRKL